MHTICDRSREQFTISELEQQFCLRNGHPLPRNAPRYRIQHLALFIAAPKFYRSHCTLSGKPIISAYSPESGVKVYDPEPFQAEEWEPLKFGQPYDFNRPFFDQLCELAATVPRQARSIMSQTSEGVQYCNRATRCKDCYLCVGIINCRDCQFAHFLRDCSDVVDCTWCIDCELCYHSADLLRCYNLQYSEHCQDCTDSYFLFDCRSCKNCFDCIGLDRKEYCFRNEQLTPSEYAARIAAVDLGDRTIRDHHLAEFQQRTKLHPLRPQNFRSENVTGKYIVESEGCANSAFLSKCQNLEYCVMTQQLKDSLFCVAFGPQSELLYNCSSVGDNAYDVAYSAICNSGVHGLRYCYHVTSGSSDCFGCINLRRKSYCILNKQYSKNEYLDLLPRIQQHMHSTNEWGRLLPAFISGYAYNGSEASAFSPLNCDDAKRLGFGWDDETLDADATATTEAPVNIDSVPDSLTQSRLRCEVTGKPFAIQRPELNFYRKLHIPIPTKAPLTRLREHGNVLNIESIF